MGRAFEYRKASKLKRWDKMSKIFPRLAKAITMAAKEGSSDPETNNKLRTAIQNAKAQNMPKDNIDAATKRATSKDAENLVEIVYEGKGPHSTLVIVECASNNTVRTVANIRSYFSKSGGEMVTSGQFEFMFQRKAVFEFTKKDEHDVEELELELIDHGLEEIELNEGTIYVYGDWTNFGTLSTALDKLGIVVENASLKRVATSPITLTEEQLVDVEKLIDKIEDDEDVLDVYTNIE